MTSTILLGLLGIILIGYTFTLGEIGYLHPKSVASFIMSNLNFSFYLYLPINTESYSLPLTLNDILVLFSDPFGDTIIRSQIENEIRFYEMVSDACWQFHEEQLANKELAEAVNDTASAAIAEEILEELHDGINVIGNHIEALENLLGNNH